MTLPDGGRAVVEAREGDGVTLGIHGSAIGDRIYSGTITFFAVFLGYGTQLVAMIAFYIVVSLWFHFWRYRFVNRGAQFTMPWPKPRGY